LKRRSSSGFNHVYLRADRIPEDETIGSGIHHGVVAAGADEIDLAGDLHDLAGGSLPERGHRYEHGQQRGLENPADHHRVASLDT
jgi:hypothetical protein